MLDENRRLAALRAYEMLDTPADPVLDRIAELSACVFDMPLSCVSLVDASRLFLKAAHGVDATELGREPGMCVTTVETNQPRQVPDLLLDEVAATHPLVTGDPHVRFYAGIPLRSRDGYAIGTLCVLDQKPRQLDDMQMGCLSILADLVVSRLDSLRQDAQRAAAARSVEYYGVATYPQSARSTLGLLALDPAGSVTFASPLLTELTGLAAGHNITDRSDARTASWGDVQRVWDDRDREGGASARLSGVAPKDDDGVVLRIESDRDDDGGVVGYLGSLHALAAPHEIGERALRAQKLESLGSLAGGIAHDFNNILAAVMGNNDLAASTLLPGQEPAMEYLANIDVATERASNLCDQLLAYSGGGQFTITNFDLSSLVGEMSELLAVSVTKKASIAVDLAQNLPPISGDVTQVRQVVLNILTNASEALHDTTGRISVSTTAGTVTSEDLQHFLIGDDLEPGEYVSFEVTDNGCGMDPSMLPLIFDPLYTTKFAGHGLGMAAVGGIMRVHHGGIDISTQPGKGTTVRALFPASALAAPKPRPAAGP
ncbi:MAG: ATP-binding protein, partial [Acidimicrobiales bacterium]